MIQEWIDQLTKIPVVGVDFDSTTIKVAQVVREKNNKVTLTKAFLIPIEKRNPVDLLGQVMTQGHFKTANVAIGLASPEVIVRPFRFPRMPRKELAGAMRFEAEQATLNGHQPHEMAVDWQHNRHIKDAHCGLLAVVPKSVMAERVRIAKEAGLKPVVVDVKGLAIWNAYWMLDTGKKSPGQNLLFINIDSDATNLMIAKSPDELILVRDIDLGADALAAGQGNDWISEIRDSLAYARSKSGLRELDVAYMTGGGHSRDALSYLRSVVSVPVSIWNPFDFVSRDPGADIEPSLGPHLTAAIGLALRQP